MKKCKYCEAELAENDTFCPSCGKDNAEEIAAETVSAEETVAEETVVTEEAVPAEVTVAEEAVPAEDAAPAGAEKSAEIKEGVKATPGKIALMVGAIVVVAAVIIALLAGSLGGNLSNAGGEEETDPTVADAAGETVPATVPADGNPDDETCKGTYTGSDEDVIAAADTVVATAGEFELTNSQLQVYYWMEVQTFLSNYGAYASMYGMDYTQPLDTQPCAMSETGGTWQQFFLSTALDSWHYYQSLHAEAEKAGFEMDAGTREFLDTLAESIEQDALTYGFESAAEYLAYNVGPGATMDDYIHFMELYYGGFGYFNSLYEQFQPTAEEVEAYFDENQENYASSGVTKDGGNYVDVRHILVMPEGGTTDENGTTTYSDEEWAACEAEAQAILDEWLAGDATEDSFAELANTHTDDGNDANYDGEPDGGLYTQVYEGQMVEPFENWCFDGSRKYGDYGLVQTTYGWHVMYFVDSYPIWEVYAENDLLTERANTMVAETAAKYPMTVDYESILLGYLDMSA